MEPVTSIMVATNEALADILLRCSRVVVQLNGRALLILRGWEIGGPSVQPIPTFACLLRYEIRGTCGSDEFARDAPQLRTRVVRKYEIAAIRCDGEDDQSWAAFVR